MLVHHPYLLPRVKVIDFGFFHVKLFSLLIDDDRCVSRCFTVQFPLIPLTKRSWSQTLNFFILFCSFLILPSSSMKPLSM